MNHFMVRHKDCDKIIDQCHCPEPDKDIIYKFCGNCKKKEPFSDVPVYKVYKGPTVTWNKGDVRKMVDAFGLAATIDELARDQFQRNYVEKIIKEILK